MSESDREVDLHAHQLATSRSLLAQLVLIFISKQFRPLLYYLTLYRLHRMGTSGQSVWLFDKGWYTQEKLRRWEIKTMLSLSETERADVQRFVRQGKANARTLTRAWVLLKLAEGWEEAKIAETFAISQATVKNVAHRFAQGGSIWYCTIKCSSDGGKL